MRLRTVGATCAMIAVVGIAPGCTVQLGADADTVRVSDTASGATADTADAPPAAAETPRADSLRALGDPVDVQAPPTTPLDRDAPNPVATNEELAALVAAGLAVPVAGFAVDSLPDTFLERRGSRPHDALDILAPRGTPVVAAADGVLLALHDSERGGLMVYASDASGRFVMLYGHLDAYAPGLTEGMTLRRGQPLGTVGTTGNAAPGTPHLHFAIARVADVRQWWRGTPVDPRPLLVQAAALR